MAAWLWDFAPPWAFAALDNGRLVVVATLEALVFKGAPVGNESRYGTSSRNPLGKLI